jgi:hypothetical protein
VIPVNHLDNQRSYVQSMISGYIFGYSTGRNRTSFPAAELLTTTKSATAQKASRAGHDLTNRKAASRRHSRVYLIDCSGDRLRLPLPAPAEQT